MFVKWTEVLSAFASAASTLLSVIAAGFAYRGVQTAWCSFELHRVQRQESTELRAQEQALQFCVWLEEVGDSWAVMVHNAGNMPVYDVYLSWHLRDPATWSGVIGELSDVPEGERLSLLGEWELGNVGPILNPRCEDGVGEWIREGAAHCLEALKERDHDVLFLPGFETAFKNIRLRTVFTDVAGVRWERRGARLQRQEEWISVEKDQSDHCCVVSAAR